MQKEQEKPASGDSRPGTIPEFESYLESVANQQQESRIQEAVETAEYGTLSWQDLDVAMQLASLGFNQASPENQIEILASLVR